ncbi:MAG: disulfide bond formation protein B [Burkholderiaceae bacterium]|nr:disulfide bond formation protein B [Burkholderiaceae bacterium]
MRGGIRPRHLLTLLAAMCVGFVGFALVLQHFFNIAPCPLCVLQRYAFLAIALFCLIGARFGDRRIATGLALLSALSGVGLALWQLLTTSTPGVSCGLDPMETVVNRLFTAEWLPFLFKADGMCGDDNGVILWLTTPQWALFWFVVLSLVLVWLALRGEGQRGAA